MKRLNLRVKQTNSELLISNNSDLHRVLDEYDQTQNYDEMISSLKHLCNEDDSDQDTQTKTADTVNIEHVIFFKAVIITWRCCIDENEEEKETKGP